MQVVNISACGNNYQFRWPNGSVEDYPSWVEYRALSERGEHSIRIGFCARDAYGQPDRLRATVWIDNYPRVEFFGADDFDVSGELLSEIRVGDEDGHEHMCRYPDEPLPERYVMFHTVGLPTRIDADRVHNGWAVVANVSDHKTMIALAALRAFERS